jgi:hypothetical protein
MIRVSVKFKIGKVENRVHAGKTRTSSITSSFSFSELGAGWLDTRTVNSTRMAEAISQTP